MIKSPLRYPGGKSRAVELISSIIPEFDEYREPFLGGGSVLIFLKQKYNNKIFWGNDLHLELYKFWQIAQSNIDELIDKIYEWRARYTVGKELHKFLNDNIAMFDDLERATAFFIYNRITFSGTSLSGGYSESAFKARFTDSSITRLLDFSKVIQDAIITNYDYSKLLNKEGNNVFLFLDPPYYSASKSALYGKNGNLHKSFDHIRFANEMKECKHKWLITYDDSDYIRELFSFANIIPWNLVYGMRNVSDKSDQNGKELFISNFIEELPDNKQLVLL